MVQVWMKELDNSVTNRPEIQKQNSGESCILIKCDE